MGWDRERLLDVAVISAPALLAAVLCLYEISTRSLWLDESATIAIASQHGGAFGSALARDGGNMLGYYALLHGLIDAFGSSAFLLRLPSAIAAGAAVAAVGALGLRLWSRRVALAAGTVMAVSLSLVYWGQDARGYALTVALTAASFLAWISLVTGAQASRRSWLAYVVLTVAAFYSGLEAVLVLPAQAVVLLWHRERAKQALSALAASLLCCIPLAVLAAQRGSSQLFWVPAPSLRTTKQLLEALTSSGLQPGFYTSTTTLLLIVTLVAVVVAAWALAAARVGGPSRSPSASLVVSWLVLPAVLALLLSLAGHSIFQARYVLVSLPAVALLLASALESRLPQPLVLIALVVLVGLRAAQLAPSYGTSAEEWRATTAYVADHAQPRDCLAFYPLDARMPFEYYDGSAARLPPSVLPALPWGRVRPYVEEYASLPAALLAGLPERCARVWLVSSHQGRLGGPPVSAANFRRLSALRGALELRYPRRSVKRLGRASPISIELLTGAA